MTLATQRIRWTVLAILSLVYVCNVADRLVLSILAQAIKHDLNLSDWEIGLLTGPVIALFYAVLGIPMAYVADRVNRVRFLALCLAMWSLLTALGGAAANALQLAAARIGVSAVEAGGSPAGSSIIADYFPRRERSTAMGVYAAASTVGVMVSFALGGLLGGWIGWRWTLVAAGAPGLVLAAVLLAVVREPVRGIQDHDADGEAVAHPAPQTLFASLATLWRNRFYREVVLAAAVSNFCFHAVLNWGPSLVMRKFYAGSGHAGVTLGIGIALCGGIAAIVGGRVTSRLSATGMGRPLRIAALLQLAAGPVMLASLFAPRLELTVALMCLSYGLQAFFIPIYWSVSQSYVEQEIRAMAAAVMLLTTAVIGPGLSAPVVGAISDALTVLKGSASLQYALALGTAVNLLAALLIWRASRTARRAEAALLAGVTS